MDWSPRLKKVGNRYCIVCLLLILYSNYSRRLSALSVALLRSIMHCIFTYTLQTEHMQYPTRITQLVEPTGSHTCSEYFFLHLIQDITDLTTITNKTFEEAVLIIHTLIDLLVDKGKCSLFIRFGTIADIL